MDIKEGAMQLQQFVLQEMGEALAAAQQGKEGMGATASQALLTMARCADEAQKKADSACLALEAATRRINELEARLNQPSIMQPQTAVAVDLTPVLAAIQQLGHRLTAMEGHEMQRVSQKRQIVFEVQKDGAGVTRQIIAKEA